ncbi:putative Cytochrome oxidase biogenesis protein Sco1/SenC/PrrC, copper metallochaperone [Sphingomonas sp. T1]|uniref:SCO family protein n=1 Tax=Sphingomonas sp. T1 TaxID=2653172 RepID=UPI0012F1DE48|nr:SCO family protein [Sphingomonas sp. T1]VXC77283.1 putative Cytochrome oxidase biogenesis protein Sco1/SenC/PrrC, copper metallochaperone [Sphingomonas sp. T1]
MTNRRPALLAALALAACSPSAPDTPAAPATPPLAGARIGGPFTLVDQDGQQVSDRRFAGKYRIMYFGYTFCPDVCPTDMQTIGGAMKLLEASDPALAARIVPIFVTVDPTRDTPAVVKQFVTAFHPRIVGLTGSPAAIETVKKEFAIFSAKGDAAPGGGYLVNHSRQAYLMDPDGKPLALLPQDKGPQALADDIKRWAR